jgi:uncharacterized protein (DUF849 family)
LENQYIRPTNPRSFRDSDAYIFRNTFRDIAFVAKEIGEAHGVKFEHQCYDVGRLYNLKFCVDTGLFKAPVFIQFIFGILGGIGPDLDNLIFMKQTTDRLFGDNYRWSVLGAGGAQMNFCDDRGHDGRQRPGRTRGLAVNLTREACLLERGADP